MNAPASGENRFYVRPNDDWVCSHCDSPSCGGCGEHGDAAEPCIPMPSVRLRRGMLTLALTALTSGVLIALLASPSRIDWLAPGPLIHAHAQILASSGSMRCSSCHGAGDQTLVDWMHDAVSSGTHIPVSQSALCMDCHNKSLLQQFSLLPHNVEPRELAAITSSTRQLNTSIGLAKPTDANGELACATCHREHHGAEFNLAALTDRQCQICHTNYIHSFEKDHPEFSSWPDQQKRNIVFDHAVHSLKHFPDKGTTFDCRRCHVDDSGGNVKLVAPFSQSCAQCHSGEVYEPESPQWTFLQLPILDTQALTNAGKSIGDWPAACEGDFDGQMPAAMRLLLMVDPNIASILKRRGDHFAFSDLDPDNPQDLEDACRIAWGIKELIFDLANSTEQTLQQRMQLLTDFTPIDVRQSIDWPALSAGIHPDLFAQMQRIWMPELSKELTDRRKIDPAGVQSDRRALFGRPNIQEQQDDDLLVENPLARLLQDEPITAVPEPAAETSPDKKPVVNNRSDNNSVDGVVANPHVDTNRPLRNDDDEDLLVENPLTESTRVVEIINPTVTNPTGDNDSGSAIKSPQTNGLPDSQFVEQLLNEIRKHESRPPVARSGGWTRNDQALAITYQPVRHVDPVMKAWIDYTTVFANVDEVKSSGVHDSLTKHTSAGACLRCHSNASDLGDKNSVVKWSPEYRNPNVRDFTRFSHQPHDSISGLSDCQSCHTINSNPVSFSSSIQVGTYYDFLPVTRGTCANCHRQGGAPSGCVDCHNYHVGSKVMGK